MNDVDVKEFSIKSGCLQGCSLYALLFNVGITEAEFTTQKSVTRLHVTFSQNELISIVII